MAVAAAQAQAFTKATSVQARIGAQATNCDTANRAIAGHSGTTADITTANQRHAPKTFAECQRALRHAKAGKPRSPNVHQSARLLPASQNWASALTNLRDRCTLTKAYRDHRGCHGAARAMTAVLGPRKRRPICAQLQNGFKRSGMKAQLPLSFCLMSHPRRWT